MDATHHKIEKMLCKELDEIADDGRLTKENLEHIDKIYHALKCMKTFMAMDEYGGAKKEKAS